MADDASNANLIFHSGEVELLREHIKDDMPNSPHPLDGKLYIPHEPIPADRLAMGTGTSVSSDDPFAPLEQAKRKAVELGKTLVCTQFGPRQHYFVVDDPQLINEVTRIWQQQKGIIGYDVKFTVEAVAKYNANTGKADVPHLTGTIFEPHTLPAGYSEKKTKVENTTQIIVSCRDCSHMAPSRLAQIQEEVEAWLAACSFAIGTGLRVLREVVKPVRRRFVEWEIGPQQTLIKPVSCEYLEPIKRCALDSDKVKKVLTSLRRALCALEEDLQTCAVALWPALEGLVDPAGNSLLTEDEKCSCKRLLREVLVSEKAKTVYDWICRLTKPNRSERIAAGLHDIVPEISETECLRLIGDIARVRGALTHNGTKHDLDPEDIRLIMRGLRRYVAQECGLKFR